MGPFPGHGKYGGLDRGPRNLPVELENPDLMVAPRTDHGTVPNLKWPRDEPHPKHRGPAGGLLEMFRASKFEDVSMMQWAANIPSYIMADTFNVPRELIETLPEDKHPVLA